MRVRFTGLLLACIASSTSAAPDSTTQQPALARAYGYAVKCWVATGASHDAAGSKLAFDAVVKLGHQLGYDNRRMNADLSGGPELVRMSVSDAYLKRTLSDCVKLGLAS
jgi:hypothetical protein